MAATGTRLPLTHTPLLLGTLLLAVTSAAPPAAGTGPSASEAAPPAVEPTMSHPAVGTAMGLPAGGPAADPRSPQAGPIDPALLAGMKARSIGPAAMSGRVAAIDAVVSDPDVIYIGAATGGVWKSVDGGINWKPIFDDQPVHSIGAVAVFQPSPDIVWVGTGEGNPRNSVSIGNGVYRSLDGGRTWTHLGLEESERIPRIVLHPTDPDVAYVCAMGRAWGDSPERGVFRTTDGGATWQKVLYVDEGTGCADLAMDPSNPRKLFAAMWQYRRYPHFFESGGPGSGLHVTHDGGDTWTRLTHDDGLPEGDLGRIGIAISRSNPEVVYALVEAERSALLRSTDGGVTWKAVNTEANVAQRPFYFGHIRVDPARPDRVYNVAGVVRVSDDGGKTFETLVPFSAVHPDHHDFWIHPEDPTLLIDANDGGVAISRDRGRSWRFVRRLPLAQFYHVAVDHERPYNVYGGLQDNGSWRGPSAVWGRTFGRGGIRNHHWRMVYFGDGFDTLPLPTDPEIGYAMSQGGYLARWDLRAGVAKLVRPPAPEGVELRFNWNAGLAIDPFEPDTVYYGSQFVHRSTDRGETWEIISPDLTTDNPEWQRYKESGGLTPDVTAAENYTTIVAIAPSPVQQGVIWVGTDDGRLHVTRNGGGTWTSVEGNLPGVPANAWIPHVEPSHFDPAGAFVVVDDHRRSNFETYVFRTDDYGRTWRSLATDGIRGYALVIEQDPVDPDLLFLGTEFGLYVSVDGGGSWMRWTHGLPTASVMDLVVQPRDHDLVIATHGRGIYILDDIRPLRGLSAGVLEEPLHLFEIPDAQQYAGRVAQGELFPGHGEFVGQNRPYGALITYSLNIEGLPRPEEEGGGGPRRGAGRGGLAAQRGGRGENKEEEPRVEIRITDAAGNTIRTFKAPARLGVNRAVWDLRRDPFKQPPREEEEFFFERGGPEVPAGTYGVEVSYGEHRAEGTVRVLPDPRSPATEADRQAKWEAILEVGALQETAAEAIGRILEARSDIDTAVGKARKAEREEEREASAGQGREAVAGGQAQAAAEAQEPGEASPYQRVIDAAKELKERLAALEKRLWLPPGTKGIPARDDALFHIGQAMGRLTPSWDAPNASDRAYIEAARRFLEEVLEGFNRTFAEEVAAFRELVREAGIELLPEAEPLRLPAPS